jgi:hypothetical protein
MGSVALKRYPGSRATSSTFSMASTTAGRRMSFTFRQRLSETSTDGAEPSPAPSGEAPGLR